MTTDISNIKQEFFLALRLGIGRAYLMAKRFRHVDFTEEIIKACIKNYAYDGQIEDSRAEYLYELINLSERKDEIVNAVLKHLSKRQSDTWTLVQLFDLAKLFAQEGNGKARKAIYDRYLKYGNESSAPWAGYSQILDLDGFEGLLFIAQKEGELLSKDNDYWVDDIQIQYFQTDNPSIRVKTRLRNAAKNNVYIQLYLDKIQETENNRSSFKRIRAVKRFTYNYIKKRIDQNSFRIITEEKANELTEKEVIKLAKEFLAEKSDLKKEQYLRFFAKRKFPYGYNELLLLAKRKTKKMKV